MATRAGTVLVVDDETNLIDVLEAYLTDEGFTTLRAADGRSAVETALREQPDLVVLDLNLPVLSGLEAFREIRAKANVPIIMLTSRGAEIDRIVGLELGADDYIAKPYSPREVVARIKAVLRRTASAQAAAVGERSSHEPHDLRRVGDLVVDRTAHEVTRAGTPVKLTPTEYRLVDVLSAHPGQAFTRDRLIELISADGGDIYDRTLDRHVANLRQKIETDPQHPGYVLTVFGLGYKMADLP